MRSTFHGLEVSRRALYGQQTAISTTGHNIANANTDGYTRQRVNLTATNALEIPTLHRLVAKGQLGTGVTYDSIQRIRNQYLDLQYRRENSAYGEWSVREQTNLTIEGIINEPSENGLASVLDRFWNSWEALNRDPSLLSARVNVRAEAINLVDTLNQIGFALQTLEDDLNRNIQIKVDEVNQIAQAIADLNENIRRIEAFGDNANDLRDKRDLLVDQLSTIVDVEVEEGLDGVYTIVAAGGILVDGEDVVEFTVGNVDDAATGELAGYRDSLSTDVETIREQLNAMVDTLVRGDVDVTLPAGYVAARNIVTNTEVTLEDGSVIPAGGTIPQGAKLMEEAEVTVQGFNGLHELGYSLDEPPESGIPFFVSSGGTFTIDNIQLNPDIIESTDKIAASGQYEVITNPDGTTTNKVIRGNSDIAFLLTSLRDKVFTYPQPVSSLSSGTIDDYFRGITSELGVRSYEVTRKRENQAELVDSADIRRTSVSGVSLDEEMANLIKFQHAYNAAARNMTTIDEMLDQVINRMGLVGR